MTTKDEKQAAPKAAAEDVTLDRIHPWPQNPRPITAKNIRAVSRSIRRFGFASPIVARRANGEIIIGHLRYMAAKKLRMSTVPVRFMDISETEAHALALADNKIQEARAWDKDDLGDVLVDLEAAGIDVEDGMGFDEAEIAKLTGDDFVTEETLVEEVQESPPEFWLSIRGPLPTQPAVLALLHEALGNIEGVTVNLGTTGYGS